MSKISNEILVQLKKDTKILQTRSKEGYPPQLMPEPIPPHEVGAMVVWVYDGKLISGRTHVREFFSIQ